jgi:uncharacterized protein (DUF2235 family)
MAKKLVLCLDGTSNRYCHANTNVIKFLALLDKRAADQLVYYQPGIGTIVPPGMYGRIKNWVATRIDLAFATLLKYHVQDAYQFLMRYHEEGDEIYVFGFSRGAYTARVLAGMLCKVGLLARGNEELVPFAWDMYARQHNDDEASGFRDTFARVVGVAFIGLWDTVSSVGYLLQQHNFAYTFDNPVVNKVRHAISLDERRAYFRQNSWKEPPRPGQDVLQVWFPGVHCDVGGGYVEAQSGLSKGALAWMVGEVGGGLAFRQAACALVMPVADSDRYVAPCATAQAHESLRGLWWLVELLPKRTRDPTNNYAPRWIVPLGRRRQVFQIPGLATFVHSSVEQRRALGGNYEPPNLPLQYTVVPTRAATTHP